MSLLLALAVVFYIFSTAFSIVRFAGAQQNKECYGSPKYIYNHSKMNVLGVTVVFAALLVIIPAYYLLCFVYWLFHVGRKKEFGECNEPTLL